MRKLWSINLLLSVSLPTTLLTLPPILRDSRIKVTTVIGFPMGYSPTQVKVAEIMKAADDGAEELDVVVNVCAVKSKDWNYVQNDVESMIAAAHMKGKVVKVIFETGLLSDDEILELCKICNEAKPNFVKTSTGFNGDGASVRIVQLLREYLEPEIQIKASGGIQNQEDAMRLIEAGARRLGSTAGIEIVAEA